MKYFNSPLVNGWSFQNLSELYSVSCFIVLLISLYFFLPHHFPYIFSCKLFTSCMASGITLCLSVFHLHQRPSFYTSILHCDEWQKFCFFFLFRLILWQLTRGLKLPIWKGSQLSFYVSGFQWLMYHLSMCFCFLFYFCPEL